MTAKKSGDRWWLTLLVAVLPAIIAGLFGWQAKETADKTANDMAVSYQLMKQALEVLQHESDGYRESLQHTNELLVKLLEQKQQRTAEDAALIDTAKNNLKMLAPKLERPHLPPNLSDLVKKMPNG